MRANKEKVAMWDRVGNRIATILGFVILAAINYGIIYFIVNLNEFARGGQIIINNLHIYLIIGLVVIDSVAGFLLIRSWTSNKSEKDEKPLTKPTSFWPPATKRHPYLTVMLITGFLFALLLFASFPLNRVPYDSDLRRLGIGTGVIAVIVIVLLIAIKLVLIYRARRK